jgi:hypothetical protein
MVNEAFVKNFVKTLRSKMQLVNTYFVVSNRSKDPYNWSVVDCRQGTARDAKYLFDKHTQSTNLGTFVLVDPQDNILELVDYQK